MRLSSDPSMSEVGLEGGFFWSMDMSCHGTTFWAVMTDSFSLRDQGMVGVKILIFSNVFGYTTIDMAGWKFGYHQNIHHDSSGIDVDSALGEGKPV